jgi:hypothetical protein
MIPKKSNAVSVEAIPCMFEQVLHVQTLSLSRRDHYGALIVSHKTAKSVGSVT